MKKQRQKQKPDKSSPKLILGITGSFGSGKSTVADFFRSYGAKIIDADKLAHRSISLRGPLFTKIVKEFGKGILKNNGDIDRRKLGKIVFEDKRLLRKLNNIIHPQVKKAIKEEINLSRARVIVLDVPLLFESGLDKVADKLIVVSLSEPKQLMRVKKKTGLDKGEITKRIKSQLPLSKKVSLADFIIDNNGTKKETKKQVENIWLKLVSA